MKQAYELEKREKWDSVYKQIKKVFRAVTAEVGGVAKHYEQRY